jgi:hypothetical protein
MTATLLFDSDGSIRCLHTDLIPLQSLGHLTVRRASTVEFDEKRQVWQVLREIEPVLIVEFESPSREACLQFESDNWELFV